MARSSLSLAEQETIILYDNELDTASIYTHDKRMLGKLKDMAKKYPDKIRLVSRDGRRSATYEVPKRCVSIRLPYNEERRNKQIQDAIDGCFPFAEQVSDHAGEEVEHED